MEKAQIIWPKTIKVIIGKYRKPRPNERTWPMIRCSIAYNGRTKTVSSNLGTVDKPFA
jgi:hypothetical protein